MSGEPLQMREVTEKSVHSFRERKIVWDITVVDKLLYLVNTVVLLVSATWLLITFSLMSEPTRSINCWSPAEFSSEWCVYSEAICSRNEALLARADNIPYEILERDPDAMFHNVSYLLNPKTLFPKRETFNSDTFLYELYLMAILSLLPFILWRVIGGASDGREFVRTGCLSSKQSTLLFFWFLITKIGQAVICAVLVVMITVLRVKAHHFEATTDFNWQTQDITVICRYVVRSFSQSHFYNVQCLISQKALTPAAGHNLSALMVSLQMWLICLLIISALNLLITAYLALLCQSRPHRISFIKRHLSNTEHSTCNQIESRLQGTGVLVLTLASRLGYAVQVDEALSKCASVIEKETVESDKGFMRDTM